jgi:transcriptional regulator with XRE-family HTH domain
MKEQFDEVPEASGGPGPGKAPGMLRDSGGPGRDGVLGASGDRARNVPDAPGLPLLPGFREMALRRMSAERRQLVADLTAQRRSAGLSQTEVAARMGTSQSAVARLETGDADVRVSTLERYAAAVGRQVAWQAQPDITHPDLAQPGSPRAGSVQPGSPQAAPTQPGSPQPAPLQAELGQPPHGEPGQPPQGELGQEYR